MPTKSGLPKMNDINGMSSTELREHIKAYRTSMVSLNGQVHGQQKGIQNPMMIRQTKRTIARMITVLIRRGEPVVMERQAR